MKLNNEIIEYIKNDSEQYMTIAKLCRSLGIDRKTYYNWLKKGQENKANSLFGAVQEEDIYTDFFEVIYNKKIEFKTQLENQLIEMSKENHKVCIYLLERVENDINDFERAFFDDIPKMIEFKKRQALKQKQQQQPE